MTFVICQPQFMLRTLLFSLAVLNVLWCFSQTTTTITGIVLNAKTRLPLSSISINFDGSAEMTKPDLDGSFKWKTSLRGTYILQLKSPDFLTKRFSIILEGVDIDLGIILIEPDITREQSDNLITLTENDLSNDEETQSSSVGLLQATRDVFLTRAAFDFSQAFFRVRGYDSREGEVLINGVLMNKFFDGRPQWNNWGGLNDVIRNQEFTSGLEASSYTFGGILGNTNIDMRPSSLRLGLRLSSSFSNRTYTNRLMATYTSRMKSSGLSYSFSASRRWAPEGYMDGTPYDAYSLFGALEYQFNEKNTLVVTAFGAKNSRGRSSAITEEVAELIGNQYNPYWGEQNNRIRNSRERLINEPVIMLNHFYKSSNFRLTTGMAYQSGNRSRSRLGYYNAPNPDPTYYRYLPSFYVNNLIGADFTNAALAREGFLNNPQINWSQLYTANASPENMGMAVYILQNDVVADTQLSAASSATISWGNAAQLDFGTTARRLQSSNYAQITDLLGAEFHEDIDPFSNTRNDINGILRKDAHAIFNYHYDLDVLQWNGFAQLRLSKGKWQGMLAGSITNTKYQRTGRFKNERFLDNSFGPGKRLHFSGFGLKSSLSYQFTGRHWIQANAALIERPPTMQNTYINPRENHEIVPNISLERVRTIDMNYFIRLPDLTGRITGFYTHFQNTTDINFFFVDSGVGSDFVQEVITDMNRLHMGIELGLAYRASPQVKLSFVASLGKYTFDNNPNVTINFDTAGAEEDIISMDGNIDLGTAEINNFRLAQGPQTALAFGVEYRDPKYWWVGATTNYLSDNYASISTLTRTASFLLNPDTGEPFADATPENVSRLLQQNPLDTIYLLNVVGGKSWLFHNTYVNFFISINNIFDEVFRTGGFEQSRNGNFGQLQQDNLRNDPSFAPKYWYGFGRTFFLNVAVSF